MNIISDLETDIAEIVFFTSAFATHYSIYVYECQQGNYSHKDAKEAFSRAKACASMSVSLCHEMGLDPSVVCGEQVDFIKTHEAAARRLYTGR